MKAAILLSGGMDSTAIAFWKRPTFAVTVDYGQRAATAEIKASAAVCEALSIDHHVIRADLSALGSGDLAGKAQLSISSVSEWWPFRNQMLITLAAMKCVSLEASSLLIGCLRTDSIHVDGTKQFIAAVNEVTKMQEGSLSVVAPGINYSAAELIQVSKVPPEILAWSHSCHVANYACGTCRGCEKHYMTLKEIGNEPY